MTLDLAGNHIRDGGAEDLAAALRVNQVSKTFVLLCDYPTVTIVKGTHKIGSYK